MPIRGGTPSATGGGARSLASSSCETGAGPTLAATVEQGDDHLGQRRPGDSPGDHVDGIVDARVDVGVRHERGGGAERDAGFGKRRGDPGGNAAAAAAWPDGNEVEAGIDT